MFVNISILKSASSLGKGPKPQTQNCNIKDLIMQKEKRDAASQRKPPKDSVAGNVRHFKFYFFLY